MFPLLFLPLKVWTRNVIMVLKTLSLLVLGLRILLRLCKRISLLLVTKPLKNLLIMQSSIHIRSMETAVGSTAVLFRLLDLYRKSGTVFCCAAINFFNRYFMGFFTNLASLLSGGNGLYKGRTWSKAVQEVIDTGTNDETYLGDLLRKYTGSSLTTAEQQANAFNAYEAQKNRDFQQSMFEQQTELTNTAYQRQVADMQAAGINPMMAVSGSGGAAVASPGSGATATSVSPSGAALNLGSILSALVGSKVAEADIALKEAQANKANAEAASTEQQTSYFDTIKGVRAEAERLSNDMTRSQMRSVEQSIDESKARFGRELANTKESEARAVLALQESILAKANADNIVYMRPYVSAEYAARTEKEKQEARFAIVDAAYRQGLIDAGVIEQSIKESNASIKVDEAIAELNRINALLQKGDKHALSSELGLLDKIDFWAKDVIGALTKVVDSVPVNFVVK